MTTYKTMDISDLGDNATAEDLELFRRACKTRQQQTNETDAEVTEHCWAGGDWGRAIEQFS